MHPELMGSAGFWVQLYKTASGCFLQYPKFCHSVLPILAYATEQTCWTDSGDWQVDDAGNLRKMAPDGSVIGLLNLSVQVSVTESCVSVGVFCQQNHTERIAVKAADRMDSALLSGLLIIIG